MALLGVDREGHAPYKQSTGLLPGRRIHTTIDKVMRRKSLSSSHDSCPCCLTQLPCCGGGEDGGAVRRTAGQWPSLGSFEDIGGPLVGLVHTLVQEERLCDHRIKRHSETKAASRHASSAKTKRRRKHAFLTDQNNNIQKKNNGNDHRLRMVQISLIYMIKK